MRCWNFLAVGVMSAAVVGALLNLPSLQASAAYRDPFATVSLEGKEYMLSMPHLIDWGEAEIISNSPDGHYVVVAAMNESLRGLRAAPIFEGTVDPATLTFTITLADTKTGDQRELLQIGAEALNSVRFEWLSDGTGVMAVSSESLRLFRVAGVGAAATPLGEIPNAQLIGIAAAPGGALFVHAGNDSGEQVGYLIPSQGRRIGPFATPPMTSLMGYDPQSGAFLLLRPLMPSELGADPSKEFQTYQIEAPNGATKFTEVSRSELNARLSALFAESLREPRFEVTTEPIAGTELTTAYLSRVGSDSGRLLIGSGIGHVEALGDGSVVAYTASGGVYVRRLVPAPVEAIRAAQRTAAMSDAKQVALELILYASDYDDVLPGGGLPWHEAIYPYLKSEQIMRNFVAVFPLGLRLADVEKPSEYVIGFVTAPGGRAVAYADGSVRWEPLP